MNRTRVGSLLAALVFTGTTLFTMVGRAADEGDHFKYFDEATYTSTIRTEMKELEKAYQIATSDKTSQGDAEKSRQKAIELSRHILRHLNSRNAEINLDEGGTLSQTEVLLNIQVMGRLLDILASEHQPHKDQWSYTW